MRTVETVAFVFCIILASACALGAFGAAMTKQGVAEYAVWLLAMACFIYGAVVLA